MTTKKSYGVLILALLAVTGLAWLGMQMQGRDQGSRALVLPEREPEQGRGATKASGRVQPANVAPAAQLNPEPSGVAAPAAEPELTNGGRPKASADETLAIFQRRWRDESESHSWGADYEHELQSMFDEIALDGAELVSAECRDTLCRIEIECESSEILQEVLRRASQRDGLRSRMAIPWIDGGHLVSYVTPEAAGEAS